MRNIAFSCLALFLASAASLGLAELLCRAGVLSTPHAVLWNRSRPDLQKKRILFLGDSFTEEAITPSMRTVREALERRGYQVLNLGESGLGPADYEGRLALYGARYRPDLVLVNYYAGNDLTDTLRDFIRTGRQPRTGWWEKSFLVHALRQGWRKLNPGAVHKPNPTVRAVATTPAARSRGPAVPVPLNPNLAFTAQKYPDYVRDGLFVDNDELRSAWSLNRKILTTIAERARELGGRVVFAIIPRCEQFSSENFAYFQALGFRVDPRSLTESAPQTLFQEFCEAGQYGCLDLLPTFRDHRPKADYCLERDDHWNEVGAALAVKPYVTFLESRLP